MKTTYSRSINNNMKAPLLLPILLVALPLVSAFSQQPEEGRPVIPPRQLNKVPSDGPAPSSSQPGKFTPFSLDFPGGTPRQLVTALEKAMGKKLNFIVPAEEPDITFPPFKVHDVSLWNLSEALSLASKKNETVATATYYGGMGVPQQSYQQVSTVYGFRSQGPPSDDSIWYFYVDKPKVPPNISSVVPKVCRYYPLNSYLERGLTVEDITTAIETGWKLLGDKEKPTINFHKETKLLIAVGEQAKLETIDAVLKALSPALADGPGAAFSERLRAVTHSSAPGSSAAPPAKSEEKPKTEK